MMPGGHEEVGVAREEEKKMVSGFKYFFAD